MTSIHLHEGDLPFSVTGPQEVGVDTELTGLNLKSDRICLVQIGLNGGRDVHLIRPTAQKPKNLLAMMEAQDVCKIFHFARADLGFLIKGFGARPRNVWCTKIAAKLSPPMPTSLKGLCHDLLDVELDKMIRTTDWSKPLLDEGQIQYAATDVIYLSRLKALLSARLSPMQNLQAHALFAAVPQIARTDVRAGRRLNLGRTLDY